MSALLQLVLTVCAFVMRTEGFFVALSLKKQKTKIHFVATDSKLGVCESIRELMLVMRELQGTKFALYRHSKSSQSLMVWLM